MSARFIFIITVLISAELTVGWGRGRSHGGGGHSRGGHSYPGTTGYSGHGTGLGVSTHGSGQQAHAYPPSQGYSGNTKNQPTQHRTDVHHSHTTHNHYHYQPPPQITYGTTTYHVYHGVPPTYVYEYRDSGSRFDTLLTGLALYNLGRMSARHDYDVHREYQRSPSEVCKLGISKPNGDYEETRIDCRLISSFIWEAESEQRSVHNTVTTVKNETRTVSANGSETISSTVTVQDAVSVKGPSMQVTQGMKCYMIRSVRGYSEIRKHVDCGVLQSFATQSLRNGINGITPIIISVAMPLFIFVII